MGCIEIFGGVLFVGLVDVGLMLVVCVGDWCMVVVVIKYGVYVVEILVGFGGGG